MHVTPIFKTGECASVSLSFCHTYKLIIEKCQLPIRIMRFVHDVTPAHFSLMDCDSLADDRWKVGEEEFHDL